MTIAEFHKKFEEEVSKYPNNSPPFTRKEWEKIWNEIYEKDWFKEGLQELRKKKAEEFCPHLVSLSDGTYSCIWSIHGPACTVCYELYPRNYGKNSNK